VAVFEYIQLVAPLAVKLVVAGAGKELNGTRHPRCAECGVDAGVGRVHPGWFDSFQWRFAEMGNGGVTHVACPSARAGAASQIDKPEYLTFRNDVWRTVKACCLQAVSQS